MNQHIHLLNEPVENDYNHLLMNSRVPLNQESISLPPYQIYFGRKPSDLVLYSKANTNQDFQVENGENSFNIRNNPSHHPIGKAILICMLVLAIAITILGAISSIHPKNSIIKLAKKGMKPNPNKQNKNKTGGNVKQENQLEMTSYSFSNREYNSCRNKDLSSMPMTTFSSSLNSLESIDLDDETKKVDETYLQNA